ncbi:ATP12 family chaperone protein [Jiella sonneratiae]|uniref:ATPase n=1 Tax=Jiella sonneratiae TaxID=2816856 RepID=A0ABS3IYK2_9HYPH|nr:ATP12 family protein [Jiella sonneratiae]MBO0902496.1 ATPase [Jiella sonneratiae]
MSDNPLLARPELPKRFYKEVTLAETPAGFAVELDGRPVRTPARHPLAVRQAHVAEALVEEWAAQGDRIDPATMPLTRLVNTTIDGILADPEPVRDDIARFAETDLLFYRAGEPDRLVTRQRERWDPLLDWAEGRFGARFVLAQGVMHVAQPEASLQAIRDHLARIRDGYAVAALHQVTTLTGSALIALAVADGRLDVEEAWALAHLDEDWNVEQWGRDAEAEQRRALRFREMAAAALLLRR